MELLSANHHCPQCDKGTFPNDEVYHSFYGIFGPRFCDCKQGEKARKEWYKTPEVQQAYRTKREIEIAKALKESRLPIRWENQTLKDIRDKTVAHKLQNYLDGFPKWKNQGIYLHSKKADKKTTKILTILCNELIALYMIPCIFLSEDQIFSKIQASFNNPNTDNCFVQKLQNIPCLCIDRFATKISNWRCEQLLHILDSRFNNSLPTYFSSFYSLEEYRKIIKDNFPKSQQYLPALIAKICNSFVIEAK